MFAFNFTLTDFFSPAGLQRLDACFLDFLGPLAKDLCQARQEKDSAFLLTLAPHLEDFIGKLFSIEKDILALQQDHHKMAPFFFCKRNFVQRVVAKKSDKALRDVTPEIECILGPSFTDVDFAPWVNTLDDNDPCFEVAVEYGRWRMHHRPEVLFSLPEKGGITFKSQGHPKREGFNLTEPGLSLVQSLDQSHYCILCHPQQKDSCSKGYKNRKTGEVETNTRDVLLEGCPLGQKISEMNTLKRQGYIVGAVAMALVDNPLLLLTGQRICYDCAASCIYQKQTPVDVPGIESEILKSLLNLPWGPEIYLLLSLWNPLNLHQPLLRPFTGYHMAVVGAGPAGLTLSFLFLRAGHHVSLFEGLKVAPLPEPTPLFSWKDLDIPLSERLPLGLGGVSEYGITVRWNKNYLTLLSHLLGRFQHFHLYDSVRLGSTIAVSDLREQGFDHIALCMGAGAGRPLPIPHALTKGVRMASDFLMALHQGVPLHPDANTSLQIRQPIAVIGGGLTAIDTATEAKAYYKSQVKMFKDKAMVQGLPLTLSPEERTIAEEFWDDGVEENDAEVWILYRKPLEQSPAFRLNPHELSLGLAEGVSVKENFIPHSFDIDDYGSLSSITDQQGEKLSIKSALIATGTHLLSVEDENVTLYGDMDEAYRGSVVKAMASAKAGAKKLESTLYHRPPRTESMGVWDDLCPVLVDIRPLTPQVDELLIHAPQLLKKVKPGQFFRLHGQTPLKPLALSFAGVKDGLLSLLFVRSAANQAYHFTVGQRLHLMGPAGSPTFIPQGKKVLLMGAGLGNAILPPIAEAMKEAQCHVTYGVLGEAFNEESIKQSAHEVLWNLKSIHEALEAVEKEHAFVIAPPSFLKGVEDPSLHVALFSPMTCMMKGICAQCLYPIKNPETGEVSYTFMCGNQDQPLAWVDFEGLQSRHQQNSLWEKMKR